MALSCILTFFIPSCLILGITLITAGKLKALGWYMGLLFSPLICPKIARMSYVKGQMEYITRWNL